jgi:hypothetical protein
MGPGWLAAGAACVGAAAACYAAINGSRTLARARQDRRDRGRPMMAAELRDAPYVPATQYLVVRNYGPTIARNVRVTFEPEIPDPDPERADESVTPFIKRRYAETIPVITPGMELDNIWFSGRPGGSGGWLNDEPIPDKSIVHIAYDGPDGTRYADEFPIDVGLIRNRTYTTSSDEPHRLAKDGLKVLKSIQAALERLGKDGR